MAKFKAKDRREFDRAQQEKKDLDNFARDLEDRWDREDEKREDLRRRRIRYERIATPD